MHLYEISYGDDDIVNVVAPSFDEAADLFVTWRVAGGHEHTSFTVDELSIEKLITKQQEQVRCALAAGLVGIAHFDRDHGWTFSAPLWQPLTGIEPNTKQPPSEPTTMRVFEFRETNEISALVLAESYDDATQLFEEYALAEGGDPDSLLWREVALSNLLDDASSAVRDAMQLNREGLVICQAEDRWIFVSKLDHTGMLRAA